MLAFEQTVEIYVKYNKVNPAKYLLNYFKILWKYMKELFKTSLLA